MRRKSREDEEEQSSKNQKREYPTLVCVTCGFASTAKVHFMPVQKVVRRSDTGQVYEVPVITCKATGMYSPRCRDAVLKSNEETRKSIRPVEQAPRSPVLVPGKPRETSVPPRAKTRA